MNNKTKIGQEYLYRESKSIFLSCIVNAITPSGIQIPKVVIPKSANNENFTPRRKLYKNSIAIPI